MIVCTASLMSCHEPGQRIEIPTTHEAFALTQGELKALKHKAFEDKNSEAARAVSLYYLLAAEDMTNYVRWCKLRVSMGDTNAVYVIQDLRKQWRGTKDELLLEIKEASADE